MIKKWNGFTAVEALLVILVVGILGFAGSFVWHHSQQKNSSAKSSSTTSTPPAAPVSQYKKFTSAQYGFSFSYPKEWGSVTVSKSLVKGKVGKAYDVRFDNLAKQYGGFVTKDWVPVSSTDSNIPGFVTYDGCKKSTTDKEQAMLFNSATACVTVTAKNYTDPNGEGDAYPYIAEIKMEGKFTKNTSIAGIQFLNAPLAINDTSTSTLAKAFDRGKIDSGFVEIANTLQEN